MQINPGKQLKRLRWILLLFFITLSLPVYFLLQTVYAQLENETYFNARHQAEKWVDQIEFKLHQLLEKEQQRSIAEYSFFNVMENQLLTGASGVKFSPLSENPPKTDIKGLVGYFQINTDGSFHLPALPELDQNGISGLSRAELDIRLRLKQQLRKLLSSKITDKKVANKEVVVADQPYFEEVQQQNVASAVEMVSPALEMESKEQSSANQNETRRRAISSLAKKMEKTAIKYKTRKEKVQLPDQAMASNYFKRAQNRLGSVVSEQDKRNTAFKDDVQLYAKKPADSAINILSFESEVTPLQLLIIGQDYFCFYRYVWHDNNRYTQGFIVNSHDFLIAMTEEFFNSTEFSSLLFVNQGKLLHTINTTNTQQEYQLYSRNLSMPFQKLELIVNAAKLTKVPGSLLVDLLALSIFSIFMIGFIAFYRLGKRQIDLAKQQQNFISAVSHELKTPLTSIRMYGEMLRSGWVTDEVKKQNYYDFIFFESERLSRLIANVLQLARLGHQQPKSEFIITSAQSLLNRISSKVEAQIEASSFQLNIIKPGNLTESIDINVDEDAFFQIMINLVDNAIKFSDKSNNKQIDIGFVVTKNRKHATFFIRDYGPGIKKHQIKKIFQLFYRSGDELTRTTPGTGIGLALVAQLAETMNASINVSNKQPGAEFIIKFPVVIS